MRKHFVAAVNSNEMPPKFWEKNRKTIDKILISVYPEKSGGFL
jgi:hypothetical protein